MTIHAITISTDARVLFIENSSVHFGGSGSSGNNTPPLVRAPVLKLRLPLRRLSDGFRVNEPPKPKPIVTEMLVGVSCSPELVNAALTFTANGPAIDVVPLTAATVVPEPSGTVTEGPTTTLWPIDGLSDTLPERTLSEGLYCSVAVDIGTATRAISPRVIPLPDPAEVPGVLAEEPP
jgi:hypothetical protein